MADYEIWQFKDNREIRFRTRWMEGHPEAFGDQDLVDAVYGVLRGLGPYGNEVTIPELNSDVAAALSDTGFTKIGYVADHDLAPAHLRAAVGQAEESAIQELKYEEEKSKLSGVPLTADVDFLRMMAPKVALDRGLEASRNGVILAVAALEAFINQQASQRLGIWGDHEDRLSLASKWILVPRQIAGSTFNKGREPFQSFAKLLRLRNHLVHPGSAEKRFVGPLGGLMASFYRPEWDVQVADGRRACVVARQMLIQFHELVGAARPNWCGLVPPADPAKPSDWRLALLMTGARSDVDFPERAWPPPMTPAE